MHANFRNFPYACFFRSACLLGTVGYRVNAHFLIETIKFSVSRNIESDSEKWKQVKNCEKVVKMNRKNENLSWFYNYYGSGFLNIIADEWSERTPLLRYSKSDSDKNEKYVAVFQQKYEFCKVRQI